MCTKEVNHYANGILGEKMAVFIILFLVSCHSTNKEADRRQAEAEMREKVQTIITQVREDCDSNLYQTARWKADSIMNKRTKIKKKSK